MLLLGEWHSVPVVLAALASGEDFQGDVWSRCIPLSKQRGVRVFASSHQNMWCCGVELDKIIELSSWTFLVGPFLVFVVFFCLFIFLMGFLVNFDFVS